MTSRTALGAITAFAAAGWILAAALLVKDEAEPLQAAAHAAPDPRCAHPPSAERFGAGTNVPSRASTGPLSEAEAGDEPPLPPERAGAPMVLGDPDTSGLDRWPGPFDAAPAAHDFDGDGTDELVAYSNDTSVYVFSTRDGRAVARIPTGYPAGWRIDRIINTVGAGTLEPGAPPSVVVANHAACITRWDFVPAQSTGEAFVFERQWEHRMDTCFEGASMDAGPTLADLDGDGKIEILVQTEEVGFYALDADGTVLWEQCWAGGNGAPAAHDLDGDGRLEYVVASDAGLVAALDGPTGAPLWTIDVAQAGKLDPGSVPATPAAADLDGKPPLDVLVAARHAPTADPTSIPDYHMGLFAIAQDTETWQARVHWERRPEWANPLAYAPLVARDVDGDGATDILGVDWNTVGHKPGEWERLGPAHVFRLDPDGTDVWVRTLQARWSNKDLLVADVDRDGRTDILVNAAHRGDDGLWRLSSATGEPEAFLATPGWQVMRSPVLLDARHDGGIQVAIPVVPDEASPTRGAILLVELDTEPFPLEGT